MSNFDSYIRDCQKDAGVRSLFQALTKDAIAAINDKPLWERYFVGFWLLGPFILLIERSPADIWMSVLALTFLVRSIFRKEWDWLRCFWVKAALVFWAWCILVGSISDNPVYSITEAVIWFRFPLFAIATAFWLAKDRRLLYAMLTSTALGLLLICFILVAEVTFVGQRNGRLEWPFGDAVPGNYIAKVGLPAFTILIALAVSIKGRFAAISGFIALISVIMSVLTGERINFLIRACAGMLAGLCWKPRWGRYVVLVAAEILAVASVFVFFPKTADRFSHAFLAGATDIEKSGWLKAIYSGWQVAQENLLFGIGTANFRIISEEVFKGQLSTIWQPHPHNYYIQVLAETGIVGLILVSVFVGSIISKCLWARSKNRDNVFTATAWVIPLGIFWPIATTADFFGQWNNVFIWSALALALSAPVFDDEVKAATAD